MTSPHDPDVQSRIRRAFNADVAPSDDLSDAWTLWAEKELGGAPPVTMERRSVPRETSTPESMPPTPSTSTGKQLPQRVSRPVDDDRARARTATSEDLLEARAGTTSSNVSATGVGAAALAGTTASDVGLDADSVTEMEVPEPKQIETAAPEVKGPEPPTVKVSEFDKKDLPNPPPAATTSVASDDRPVADRGMVGETAGQARFERVDSVVGDDESSSPRLGWLILGALIAACLVAALMWLWKRPPSTESVPTSSSTTSLSTPGVTSPTASTAPGGFTATTVVGAGAGAGGVPGATGAGMLSINTTSIAFSMGETSKGIVVRNMGTAPTAWMASGPLDAVTITPASGTLEPGAIAIVQINRGIGATLGETAQVEISTGSGAPQIVTVTF